MGDYLLVVYSELKNMYSILGCGTLEDMQKIQRSFKGQAMMKLKVVEKPKDVTLEELVSSQDLLKERFGYIKDATAGFDLDKEVDEIEEYF